MKLFCWALNPSSMLCKEFEFYYVAQFLWMRNKWGISYAILMFLLFLTKANNFLHLFERIAGENHQAFSKFAQ